MNTGIDHLAARITSIGVCLLVLTMTTATSCTSLTRPSAQQRTITATCATDLRPELAKLKVPGLSAGIVADGRLRCAAVAGMANIENKRPVTTDTLFQIGSVSKVVTGTALMQLYEDQKLRLDDDINKYLPFKIHIPACPNKSITFRQLLTHTSSLKDYPSMDVHNLKDLTQGDSKTPLGDYLKSYLTPGGKHYSKTVNFHKRCPGTGYDYSNMGFVLIGYLVERISHTSLERFSEDHIFAPLSMTETAWKLAELKNRRHIAMPNVRTASGAFKPLGYYGYEDWPDGMLRTSVAQLARFLLMFMQDGTYRGSRILRKSTVREMRQVQFPRIDEDQGLAWYHDHYRNRQVIGHDGDDPGVTATMFYDPAKKIGVILFANGQWDADDDTDKRATALVERLFKEADEYQSDGGRPVPLPSTVHRLGQQ